MSLLMILFLPHQMAKFVQSDSMLDIIIVSSKNNRSMSVYDSDTMSNLIHMEALVGTLFTYNSIGHYEPYLADTWTVNPQKNKYEITLKSNLEDEHGKIYSSKDYVDGLLIILKTLSKSGNIPTFSKLKGWNNFTLSKNKNIEGLYYSENKVIFEFEEAVDGLLEFLSMPYYGLYNKNDFNDDGSWKNQLSITSTGKYKITKFNTEELILTRRYSSSNNFDKVRLKITSDPESILSHDNTLIIYENKNILKISNNFKNFNAIPTILFAIELNPESLYFKIKENRIHFKNLIRDFLTNKLDISINEKFYSLQKTSKTIVDYKMPNQKIRFLRMPVIKNNNVDLSISKFIDLYNTLNNYKIDIVENIPKSDNYIKSSDFNESFDFRIKGVDTGSKVEPWVIDMMFNSKLGVSFPDPDNSIKNLINNYKLGKYMTIESLQDDFERILDDESYVIPVFRRGFSFLVSENIDENSFSQTSNLPRIDFLRYK